MALVLLSVSLPVVFLWVAGVLAWVQLVALGAWAWYLCSWQSLLAAINTDVRGGVASGSAAEGGACGIAGTSSVEVVCSAAGSVVPDGIHDIV